MLPHSESRTQWAAQPVKHPRVSDFSWRQGGNQRKNIILTEPPNAKWKPPQHLFDKISQGSRSWRQESVETFQPSCLQIQIMQLHLPSLGKLWKSCCFAKELILFLQSLDHRKRQGKKNERMDSFRILKFETAKQSKLQTKIPFPKRHLLHHPAVAHGPSRPNETTSHEWNWRMLRLQGSYFVLVPFSNSLAERQKKSKKYEVSFRRSKNAGSKRPKNLCFYKANQVLLHEIPANQFLLDSLHELFLPCHHLTISRTPMALQLMHSHGDATLV